MAKYRHHLCDHKIRMYQVHVVFCLSNEDVLELIALLTEIRDLLTDKRTKGRRRRVDSGDSPAEEHPLSALCNEWPKLQLACCTPTPSQLAMKLGILQHLCPFFRGESQEHSFLIMGC